MTTRLSINILANIAQSIVGALLLFALYRYINLQLGIEELGVWSVVLATVSASRLVDLGLSAGVVRFVARDCARGDFRRAAKIIDTVSLTLLVLTGVALPLLYPLLSRLLPHVFDGVGLEQALEILPYALFSLWLTVAGAVCQGGLDGCQRMGLRAGLVVSGQCLLLFLAYCLVPEYGLVGLALAQIGQSTFLMVVGRVLLLYALPLLSWFPYRWDKWVLKSLLSYGANVQAATLFMMLSDPITKLLLARFGGAAAAGLFEMAIQTVLKAGAIIVAANQAIVPRVAEMVEDSVVSLDKLYRDNMQVIVFVLLPTLAFLVASGGVLSWLLLGTYQPDFILFVGVAVVCRGINILSVPAYFYNQGTGRVGWNTLSHAVAGSLNIVLGWFLASAYGMYGALVGYAIAVSVSSMTLILAFHYENRISYGVLFDRKHRGLCLVCLAVVVCSWYSPGRLVDTKQSSLILMAGLAAGALSTVVWMHPIRRQLIGKLVSTEI